MKTATYIQETPTQVLINALDPFIMSNAVYTIEIVVGFFMVLLSFSAI